MLVMHLFFVVMPELDGITSKILSCMFGCFSDVFRGSGCDAVGLGITSGHAWHSGEIKSTHQFL